MAYTILFGKKYFGKDIKEVSSGFLVWCIEEYDKADWLLIQSCKEELAYRLKLDFIPPPKPITNDDIIKMYKMELLDELYASGRSAELVTEIAKGHVSWTPKKETINVGDIIVKLMTEVEHLKDVIFMSCVVKWNPYKAEMYLNSPQILASDFQTIREMQL